MTTAADSHDPDSTLTAPLRGRESVTDLGDVEIEGGVLRGHMKERPRPEVQIVGVGRGDGASALIGAIATSDRGTIYFAILNHGVPVSDARRRQDRFVRALLAHYHTVPWDYVHDVRPAVARATAVIVAQPIGPQ